MAAGTPVVTGNPFKFSGATDTATKITDSEVVIQAILWYGATTDAHKASLTDKAGNTLWKGQMKTTNLGENIPQSFPLGLHSSDGIYCDDLDSGELYIYIK